MLFATYNARFTSRTAAVALICLGFVCTGFSQTVSAPHRRSLAELVDESANIVHGRVMSVRVEPHPELKNLPTVVVTVEVLDNLKGSATKQLVFRQFIWDIRAQAHSSYRKNEELLLFLRPPSRYGLTSPAGLEQGKFTITRDATGKELAVNGDNNAGLFVALATTAQKRGAVLPASAAKLAAQGVGPMPLSDLKQVVSSLARRGQ